jgi:hypothetical protein
MATLADILARRKDVTGQISTQIRTFALGFIAISWALLTAHDEPLHSMVLNVDRSWILWLAGVSVIVLLCDLAQYVSAEHVAKVATDAAEKANPREAEFDDKSRAYRLQMFFYHAKFYILLIDAALLVFIFVHLCLPIRPQHPVQNPPPSCAPICCPNSPAPARSGP